MKRLIYTIILLSIFTNIKAGDDKTVTLITSGQGQTQDVAKQNALRNAIEQAFGAFISSRTEIVNDKLIKDEIVTLATGNILNFKILSEILLPDRNISMLVEATVSIANLTKFCESKGVSVDVNGGLFAANIKLLELNRKNEEDIINHVFLLGRKILDNGIWNYSLVVNTPLRYNDKWDVRILVEAEPLLNNFDPIIDILNNISMSQSEIDTYNELNEKYYNLSGTYFRSNRSFGQMVYLMTYLTASSIRNFFITNGLIEYKFNNLSCPTSYTSVLDNNKNSISNVKIKYGESCSKYDDILYKFIYEYDHYLNLSFTDEMFIRDFSEWSATKARNLVQKRNLFFVGFMPNKYCFEFVNTLSTEEISKISKYTVGSIK